MEPAGLPQLQALVERIINLSVPLVFILLTIALLYAGIKLIMSGGDQKNIQAARSIFFGSLTGIGFLAAAFIILRLIEAFSGVKVTQFCLGFPPNCL